MKKSKNKKKQHILKSIAESRKEKIADIRKIRIARTKKNKNKEDWEEILKHAYEEAIENELIKEKEL